MVERWKYLIKKWTAGTLICIGLLLLGGFGFLTVFGAIGTILSLIAYIAAGFPNSLFGGLMSSSIAAAICGTISYFGIQIILKAHNQSVDIPHVPPVREQIAALPSEAILLRGSDEPAAAPDELLRSAQRANLDAAVELLRPNQPTRSYKGPEPTSVESRGAER